MSGARIIDGRRHAAELRATLKDEVASLLARYDVAPALHVVLVGDHPASAAYVRTKDRMAREVGIASAVTRLAPTVERGQLLEEISRLNADPAVHGILVQLPLPQHLDPGDVLEAIDPGKDVDGFHPLNAGRLATLARRVPAALLVPCTPSGCLKLLEAELGVDGLAGRHAVVLGRSSIVGKPMAQLLLASDCTVTIAHSRTRDLATLVRNADILVAAVGRPEMVPGAWIAPGATVIDVGINRVQDEDGAARLIGDVAFEEARRRASAITPVPGGVGPMTVACLLENTVKAFTSAMARCAHG